MANDFQQIKKYTYGKSGGITGEWERRPQQGINLSGLLTSGILVWLGYLMLTGVIAFSKQMQILVLIGVGIWWLSRR